MWEGALEKTASVPAGIKARLRATTLGGKALILLKDWQTPGIMYLSGSALLGCREDWCGQIEALTRAEAHLLPKTRLQLEPAAVDGRLIVAMDTTEGNRVVGCIALWELAPDETRRMWYELGTFTVVPDHRFKARGPKAMPIGDALYQRLLFAHRDKNILGTTTNMHAIHTGYRHGMQMVRFSDLPNGIQRATCICPREKTGVDNNDACRLRNTHCRVRVSFPTWVRMGRPTPIPFPY